MKQSISGVAPFFKLDLLSVYLVVVDGGQASEARLLSVSQVRSFFGLDLHCVELGAVLQVQSTDTLILDVAELVRAGC